jgi:hypothetical protein
MVGRVSRLRTAIVVGSTSKPISRDTTLASAVCTCGLVGGCYKSVTRVSQGCYTSVTRVLHECHKSVLKVL